MLHPPRPTAAGVAASSAQAAPVLDDLLCGINEWRNIQDVVRITFKAFHDVLRQQGESIKCMERTLDTKASRPEVSVALSQKANANEMTARLAELEVTLHKKADMADMERRALKSDVDASLRTQMSDVFTIMNAKGEATEMRALREASERRLGQLSGEIARLQQGLEDARVQLHTKATVVEVEQALTLKADLGEVEDRLRDKPNRRQVADALALKADMSGVDLVLGQMRTELSDVAVASARKADSGALDEMAHRVERLRQRQEADSDATALALRTVSSTFDEALARVQAAQEEGEERLAGSTSSGLADCEASIGSRLEQSEQWLREQLSRKADVDEVQRWLEEKADLEAMAEELDARAPKETVEELSSAVNGMHALHARVAKLSSDLANKAAADRNLYAAIETKANVEDVNSALVDVCAELERRAAHDHVDLVVADHAALKATVQAVSGGARWLWKSGVTKGGGAVPWNLQAVNTDPSNFVWEADKTVVMAMAPGLYRVEVGFYSRRQPVVQVLVDGDVAITLVNSGHTSNAVHHGGGQGSSARLGTTCNLGLHGGGDGSSDGGSEAMPSAGNITGCTCTDFLSLPRMAKIAVAFHGDAPNATGFLGLYKL